MGRVYIVGFGPGNMELLTLKAMELIRSADVIIYDHLINPEFLNYVKKECIKIYVGKKPYNKRISQDDINNYLIEYGRKYNIVVRLKGGDPFLFGRGGEEVQALISEKIEYEIVPGVSSLISVPEYAGIPVTHRKINHGIIVTTGNNIENLNIPDCRNFDCTLYTLIIFMGAANLKKIREKLIISGYNENTKIAVIENGTYNYQKTYTGTLGALDYEYTGSPALIVVGETVNYSKYFNLIEKKPFAGHTITFVYNTEMPDISILESIGFTVLKIKNTEINFTINKEYNISKKDIVVAGNYIDHFMDFLKINKIDIRNLGRIATDKEGRNKLEKYGIFDTIDKNNYRGNENTIVIDGTSSNKIKINNIKSNYDDNYIDDYVRKSNIIIILDGSDDPFANIDELKNIKRLFLNYPYEGMINNIKAISEERYENY